jgi:hypothetical protein
MLHNRGGQACSYHGQHSGVGGYSVRYVLLTVA